MERVSMPDSGIRGLRAKVQQHFAAFAELNAQFASS